MENATRLFSVMAIVTALGVAVAAQRAQFDVASVKLHTSDDQRVDMMLQTLLADRFKLTTHREKRELPVFALERARRDACLGPGLRPTACPELRST
jgi:uncharacterized protein (TIGR03435 family)